MRKILYFIFLMITYVIVVLFVLIKLDMVHIKFINPKKTTDEYINNGLSLQDEELSNSNGRMDKFYYNQLSGTAKILYDAIIENKEEIKTGTKEISFLNHEFDKILEQENGLKILSDEYQNAVDAIRYDHVDMFYIDCTKMAMRTITRTMGKRKSYEVYLSPAEGVENYLEDHILSSEITTILEQIEVKKKEILEKATGSNYQKIQYVHNWLIDNIKYESTQSKYNIRNIYGAIIENEVVCEGYAKAFKYLLDELEIPCILVSGDAINSEGVRESHMWNYVQINDIWYSVDVTWDDPKVIDGGPLPESARYKYFCQGDNINENHFLSKTITDGSQAFEHPKLYHKEVEEGNSK